MANVLSEELTDDSIAPPSGGDVVSHGGLGRRILSVFVENKLAVVGVIVIVFFILFCYVGPFLYHSNQTNAAQALFSPDNAPPGKGHPLGTDESGFDILGRLMYGGQVSLARRLRGRCGGQHLRGGLRAISGFFGKWVDAVMMRVVDAFLSIPIFFLAIVLAVIFRPLPRRVHLRHRLRVVADPGPAHPGPGLSRCGSASTCRPCG